MRPRRPIEFEAAQGVEPRRKKGPPGNTVSGTGS